MLQQLASSNPNLTSQILLLVLDTGLISVAECLGKLSITCQALSLAIRASRELHVRSWVARSLRSDWAGGDWYVPMWALQEYLYWKRQRPRVTNKLTHLPWHQRDPILLLCGDELRLDDRTMCPRCWKRKRARTYSDRSARWLFCRRCRNYSTAKEKHELNRRELVDPDYRWGSFERTKRARYPPRHQ
jgi:hypothetical protein